MAVGWDDSVAVSTWHGLPSLAGDRTADACVVGLGATGLAAIAQLIQRGFNPIGVDAGRVGAGAAGRNGGFLLGGPHLFLHDAIARWGEDAAVGLYRATLAELDAELALLGDEVIERAGSIRLAGLPGDPRSEDEAADRERELADCAEHEAALRRHGIAVETYDGELGRGLYLPDDAATNPARRVLDVADRLVDRYEVDLYENTPVQAVEPGRVITTLGTVHAEMIIVAVDGRLDLLLPQLAGRVRTARLQMLATSPVVPQRLPCPVYGRWGYDYAQQDADGRIFAGGGRDLFVEDEWTHDDRPTAPVQTYVERVASRMAGRDDVRVTHRWAASVGFSVDGRPLCTRIADFVGVVGGYSGTGNLVGPVAARAAVDLVVRGTPPPPYFAS